MINVYAAPHELTSPMFALNFAPTCGGTIIHDSEPRPGTWAGFGSPFNWRALQASIQAGETWYYADHAYFGRRHFFRITKNAYQTDGFGESDIDRFRRFIMPIRPWRRHGQHIVICAQSQSHYDRHGVPNWVADTCRELAKHTDRPMIVREKRGNAVLEHHLSHAWAVVAHTSNAAVDAVIAGVPAFVTAPCAASRVAKSSLAEIERPLYAPDRDEWAGVLAASQWTMHEIATGAAWRKLQGS